MADGDDAFVRELEVMVADAAAGAASLDRRRERGLRRAAAEEATLAGLLVELAERRAPVTLRTTAGHVHVGAVTAVGADFVVVRAAAAAGPVLVSTTALASVRPVEATGADVAADRPPTLALRLGGVLVGLVAERPRLRIVVRGGETLTGTLRSCGTDVVTLDVDRPGPSAGSARLGRSVHVALANVVEVTVLD